MTAALRTTDSIDGDCSRADQLSQTRRPQADHHRGRSTDNGPDKTAGRQHAASSGRSGIPLEGSSRCRQVRDDQRAGCGGEDEHLVRRSCPQADAPGARHRRSDPRWQTAESDAVAAIHAGYAGRLERAAERTVVRKSATRLISAGGVCRRIHDSGHRHTVRTIVEA